MLITTSTVITIEIEKSIVAKVNQLPEPQEEVCNSQLRVSRLNKRTVFLLLGEAILVFCAVVGAVYLRIGVQDAPHELIERHGYLKAAFARFFV